MKISCWADLALFISQMSSAEKCEPVKIVVDDQPIAIAREIEKAKDFYIRPKGEVSVGHERREVMMSDVVNKVSDWERSMDKGDVFLIAY